MKKTRFFIMFIVAMIMITGCTSCKPEPIVILPTVASETATYITKNSAVINATITNNGGGDITGRGFYFSASGEPSSASTIFYSNNGLEQFSYTLTDLEPNTTYYY